jgi:hypothetical protein
MLALWIDANTLFATLCLTLSTASAKLTNTTSPLFTGHRHEAR